MRESTRDTGALIWPQGRSQSPGMFCSMKSHCRSAKALNLNPLCHLTTRISNSYLLGEFLLIRITVALLIKIKQSSILMVVSTSSSISRIGCRLSYTRVVQQSTSIITMHSWPSFAVHRGGTTYHRGHTTQIALRHASFDASQGFCRRGRAYRLRRSTSLTLRPIRTIRFSNPRL